MTYKDKVLLTMFVLLCFAVFLLAHHERRIRSINIHFQQPAPFTQFMEGWDEPLIPYTDVEVVELCSASPECHKLAEAVVYEARGESLMGQFMVGSVILNRVDSKRFPNTVRGVVHQKYQFEYLDNIHTQKKPSKKDWNTAYHVAFHLRRGLVERITHSDHYLNPKAVARMPRWTRVYTHVATVGNHAFYASR